MATAECKALESVGMTLENIIGYYQECGKHIPEQDNESVDHRDESSIYPVELMTLNAFPAMGDKPGRS